MADKNVTLICAAADLAAAEALASQFPMGSGTFSVPLTVVQGGSVATHYAGSGYVDEAMASAMDVNLEPMFKVFSNDAASFWDNLAACVPPLYMLS